jgi:hypothetical protein
MPICFVTWLDDAYEDMNTGALVGWSDDLRFGVVMFDNVFLTISRERLHFIRWWQENT